ncbi:Uncharacterised protein [Mycobacteroides abscessus subsp. abscessus]|nr:Uncharacterised protein [Mycobacteroides abscessus subsp. abscessus]SIM95889.1 Uncharacterised protein [Mycobacteroides abscessus subsp. abscessus]SKF38762.1 Uncharacterised protein [Mycobacteroides abscessus subsp. massiliense]
MPTIVFRQSMNICTRGLSPLCLIRAVGQSLRGSVPDASMSSLPIDPMGVQNLSQTVKRKVVSTFDFFSVNARAVVAMRVISPDWIAAFQRSMSVPGMTS